MKTIYRNLLYATLSTSLCLFLTINASAQHDGGSRPSGSSGSSASPHPSGGGGGGAARSFSPRPGGGGMSRPPGSGIAPQRSGFSPQRGTINHQGQVGHGGSFAQRVGSVNHQGVAVRGNFGGSARAGVGIAPRGGAGYRSIPSVGYGRGGAVRGGGYWGSHGYNHYNHGYYTSYYAPRLGFGVSVLPYGYYPFYFGDYQYYYSDGLYYQYDNSQYTVVEPPVGAQITTLPDKAQSIVINGQQYYELNGVYYQAVTKDDGTTVYEIAGKDGQLNTGSNVQDDQQQDQGPQMGDIVPQLPQDSRKINVNGQKLYVSPDGVYYQEQAGANGATTYKVVGLPSDEPDQN